jgi:hypothetical protein
MTRGPSPSLELTDADRKIDSAVRHLIALFAKQAASEVRVAALTQKENGNEDQDYQQG